MKKQDRYVYPAVLTYEDGQEISVVFPDLPGCTTQGASDEEAIACGREALGLHLWGMEEDGNELPAPSRGRELPLEENQVLCLIDVYMPAVRMAQENRSVNRTVTLPAWQNARALQHGVNFSQVLQDALRAMLGDR